MFFFSGQAFTLFPPVPIPFFCGFPELNLKVYSKNIINFDNFIMIMEIQFPRKLGVYHEKRCTQMKKEQGQTCSDRKNSRQKNRDRIREAATKFFLVARPLSGGGGKGN